MNIQPIMRAQESTAALSVALNPFVCNVNLLKLEILRTKGTNDKMHPGGTCAHAKPECCLWNARLELVQKKRWVCPNSELGMTMTKMFQQ